MGTKIDMEIADGNKIGDTESSSIEDDGNEEEQQLLTAEKMPTFNSESNCVVDGVDGGSDDGGNNANASDSTDGAPTNLSKENKKLQLQLEKMRQELNIAVRQRNDAMQERNSALQERDIARKEVKRLK